MDIVCKQCNATYSIPVEKLPKQKASAACKRCGYKMVINESVPGPAPAAAIERCAAAVEPQSSAVPAPRHPAALLSAFPDLADFAAARYDLSQILSPDKKGNYITRLNRLKVKLLNAVKPALDRMIGQEERVLRVAAATAYFPAEVLLGNGILTMLYNRYALVATQRRLVMININCRMNRSTHYMMQMPFDQIKKISRGFFRTSLNLIPKAGKRRIFTSLKPALAKELLDFSKPRLTPHMAFEAEQVKPNLCPACFAALGLNLTACTCCHAAFKKPAVAALRSFVLPGLGDFYLGHRFLGLMEMAGAALVWLVVLSMLLTGGARGIPIALMLLIFFNGFDSLLTLHMAKKGYLLADNQPMAEPHAKLAGVGA